LADSIGDSVCPMRRKNHDSRMYRATEDENDKGEKAPLRILACPVWATQVCAVENWRIM